MSKNAFSRQFSRFARVDLTPANIGAGNEATAKLPLGALIVDAGLYVVEAFDGTGTVTGTISDGSNNLVAAQDVKTTGDKTAAVTSSYLAEGGTVTFSLADANGDSTVGHAVGYVEYLPVANDENYG